MQQHFFVVLIMSGPRSGVNKKLSQFTMKSLSISFNQLG